MLYVTFVALGEVVIKIFDREFGSQSEYDTNGFRGGRSPHYPVSLQWTSGRHGRVKLCLAFKDLGDVLSQPTDVVSPIAPAMK